MWQQRGSKISIGNTLMSERKTGTSHPGLHVRDRPAWERPMIHRCRRRQVLCTGTIGDVTPVVVECIFWLSSALAQKCPSLLINNYVLCSYSHVTRTWIPEGLFWTLISTKSNGIELGVAAPWVMTVWQSAESVPSPLFAKHCNIKRLKRLSFTVSEIHLR